MSIIHIKISRDENSSKYISLLRKYTLLGITEIRDRILQEQPVVIFDSFDEDECEHANKVIAGIHKLGGEVKLFNEDDNEEWSLAYYGNLQKQREETSQYLQDITDLQQSKIRISIGQDSLGMIVDTYTIVDRQGNNIIIESEFNNHLMQLLQTIVEQQIAVKVYQIEIDESSFDEKDEVIPAEILDHYRSYFE